MKRADKEHLKRVITVLLIASMLVGTSQVPKMPPVTVVAWADDDIDLLNADADEGTIIGDITEGDVLQSDKSGDIPEEDVLLPDTSGDIDPDDAENDGRVEEGPAGSTEILRGLRNDRSGPQNTAGTTLNDVSYIDENGVAQTCSSATALSESMTELTPGWYVVSEDIVLHHSVSMNEQGDYHIILADNKEMRIGEDEWDGIDNGVGLGCLNDNSSKEGIKLYIYAQSKGDNAGELNIYNSSASSEGRATVGDAINVDELTINGGKIIFNAGGSRSHGINTNNLTINGGNIDACGTIHAINSTGTIVMNNGSLKATAGAHEGNCGLNSGEDITINGGSIEATATGKDGHALYSGEDITINGGTVIADAGNEFNFDEMSGGCGLSAGGNITISGNVTANAYGNNGHGIDSSGNIIIKDGNVTATTKGEFGHALYSPHNITIEGGTIDAHTYFDNANAIFCDYTGCLTVNGGSIRSLTEKDSASGIKADSVTINDGEVYAEAKNTEEANNNFGIRSDGRITINGGRVTAKGMSGGIHSQYSGDDGSALLLSWKNETDFVCANSFSLNTNQNVAIEPGKTFKTSVNGQDHYYVAANASEVKRLTDFKLTATSDTVYAVKFDCGEYTHVPPLQILKEGSKVTAPDDPKEGTKYNGLDFAGWYQDESYQIRYDFDSRVTADLYLHARWAERSTDMKDASVKMIYRYTGNTIEPVVENNIGETLRKGTDYDITGLTYEKTSTAVDNMNDPGFYRLTVTGKDTYGDSKTVRVCVLTFDEYDPVSGELKQGVTLPEGKDAAIVTASTISMNTGWYVVTESVRVNSRMKVNGDVHLVICDGVTLDAGGDAGNRGISVTEGNSLTIYSQSGNTGKLNAGSDQVNYYAAIGGDCPANYSNNANNNINNNNGNFSFLNGKENGNAGNITIHGGEIIAKGSMYSAAIGKAGKDGANGKGGKIIIYGGKITAERFTSYGDVSSQSDTAIGGPGAEIHLSHCREDDYILSEGYQGTLNFDRAFIIEDTSTLVRPENINDSLGKKILPVDSFNVCVVTFDSNGGTPVKAQTLAMGRLATMPATPIKRGYKFVGWYTDHSCDEQSKFDFTSKPVDTDLTLYAKWVEVGTISYIGADGQISGFKAYSLMQADYTELPDGSYYVDHDITLPARVKVTGEVNLILGDDYTLTVPWGIGVMGDNTLNIFCQSGGTGRLIANAASENAAIGGDSTGDSPSGSSGNINIYGGNIEAQGGTDAASIGGGKNNQNYGTIRIYGGTIKSLSGKYAAAIGGGQISATKNAEKVTDGTIEIYGGTVTVSANAEGTGIGGGKHSYGGDISILGGKVTVTVSPNNAPNNPYSGIGDGYLYEGAEKAQITLGCKTANDFIYSEQYYGNVRVAPYQTLQLAEDPSKTFYGEIPDPNAEIKKKTLIHSHTHVFDFSVNGSTIIAKCQDQACTLHTIPAVLTLSAPSENDIIYDGSEHPAIVTDEHGIGGYSPVYYQKQNGNSWGEKVTEAPEDVGTYLASLTLSDERSGSNATVSVEYTIIKRDVTITGITADNKIYDDTTAAKVNDTAINLENMVDGDAVSIVSGNAAYDSADVGDNKTVTFTGYYLTGAAAGNYNLVSQPASVSADIEKRPVTIKANDQKVQIGEAIEEMAVSYEQGTDTGILTGRGHALKVLTLTPDPDPRSTVTLPENGTIPGTITPSGAVIKRGDADVTGNYDITYQNGSLEITLHKAKVTKLPAAGVDLKYKGFEKEQWLLVYPGEAETKMEYKVEQISKGNGELLKNSDGTGTYVIDNEAPTQGYGDNFSAWEAGAYHVWYRAASANDLLPGVPGCINVNIATAPLTVKVPDASISYGDEFPALTPVVNGFVTPEEHAHIGTVKLEYLSGGEWKNAEEAATQRTYPAPGTYPLSVSYNGDGEVTSCYDVTYVSGNLTVEPRTVILNWADTSLIYNGSPQVPAVRLSNLASNEDPASVGVCMAGQQVNAGQNYTATAAVLTGTNANKYKLPSDNTKAFSIAKSNDAGDIPNVEIDVPLSATSFTFTASVAGKMPRDAGELTYNTIRTVSTNGFEHLNDGINDGIAANVDQNGLVTVTINRDIQNNIDPGDKLFVCADVDSTNYNTKSITVEATFVSKADAGVRITLGNAISISYDQANTTLTLGAQCSDYGPNGKWTWESSHPEVAAVHGNNNNSTGNCEFNIRSVGTSRISVRYDSDGTTGYADLILTVNPVYVSVPEVTKELNYTGSHQMCMGNYDNKIISVSGASASMPGEYVATIALNDTDKYRWEDGTKDEKSISWRINKMNGPAAPTGLTGIAPTTGDNIDGKISGVKNTMEYSTNESFTGAILCTNGDISGLTPGYYYVRVRETETEKAGAAVKVEVKACPVPVVKARQGLVYNGSSQVLAESDTASNGKLYYAVIKKGDPEPAGEEYTLSSPTATNAGSYYVWYKTSLNDKASCIEATIGKKPATVMLSAEDKIYDGTTAAKLTITVDGVCAGDSIVIKGLSGNFADKNVGSAKNVSIDSSGKIIIGAENYKLSDIPDSTQAAITKRNFSNSDGAVVIRAIPVQYYTGSEVRPEPVVKCFGTTLEKNVDYTVSYTANTAMGTASVTVSGINNCEGSITQNFEIGLPAFGFVAVVNPADISYGAALGAAPAVTARDAASQDIDLTGETVTVYYSSSRAGTGTVWNPSKADLNAGTYYVWAEVAEKTGDGGHAAARSDLVSFKVNKVQYGTLSQNILPEQAASYDVTVALPAGAKNTEYEYAITSDSASEPDVGSDAWSVLPVLTNGKFTVTGLNANTNYKIWLRRKADANHTVSAAIYKLFSTPTTVMLSYDLNGGSGTVPEAKIYDDQSLADTIDSGLNISRYGYAFRTWNTSADGKGNNVAAGKTDFMIPGTTVLYAQWSANQYTVSFQANGGQGIMADQIFTYGISKDLRKSNFSRSGYTFAGWATSAGGEAVYKDEQNVKNLTSKGTITLYAVWVDESWSVSGDVKEENGTDQTAVQGINVKLKRGEIVFGKEQTTDIDGHYSFSGVPSGIYNLVATRDLGNGKEQTVTKLVEVTSGNVDVGKIVMPDENINSKLKVEAGTPAVMVGGLDAVAAENVEDGKEVTVTMTVETKSEADAEGAEELRQLAESGTTEDKEVEIDFLDVSIEKQTEGVGDKEAITETDKVIELIIPFSFAGRKNFQMFRFHEGEAMAFRKLASRPAYPVDGTCYEDHKNSRIFAYSRLFSTFAVSYESSAGYMITYRKNDGTGDQYIQEIAADTAMPVKLTPNTFSRSGYSFSGWNTEANGEGTSYTDGQNITLTSDLVLYAQWTQNSSGGGGGGGGGAPADETVYAVTVTNGTGTGNYKAGSSVEIRADEPEEGKRFKEWEGADDLIFTTGSKTTANAIFTMPEREVNLKAIYEELPAEIYTVTVTDDGHGIGSASPDCGKCGTKVTLKAQPSEGYKFKEWQVVSGNIIITEDSFIIGEENVVVRAVFEEDEDHTHEYTSVVTKEPTCTETGIKIFTCECGDSYTEEIPALGHDYEGEITKDPTTEADGEKTYTCRRCGHSYTEVLPKLSDSLLLYEKVKNGYEVRVSKKLLVSKGFTLVPKFASGKVVNERVVWESTNPDVATVTQDGKVKAISGGETTVFIRSEENPELTAYCIITVNEPVTKITLDKSRVRFGRGEKATLTAELLPYTAQQKLVWSTANASIVILCDEKGDELPGTMNGKKKIYNETGSKTVYVKAVGAGSAKVTAMAADGSGKKSSCSFSVGNPVPAFSIHGKGKSTEVKAGKTLTMQVEWDGAKPKNTDVTWYVLGVDGKNPVFTASISDKGVLTGITAGKVKVLAVSKANPEKTADAEITVTAPEKGKNPEITAVRLTNAGDLKNKGLNLGKSYKLKTSLETSGTGKAGSDAVAWISSDSNVATVSQKGVVKAVAPGKVTIIAVPRYTADISAAPRDSVTFTVYAPVKKVKLDKTKLMVGTQTGSTYGKIGIAAVTPSDATNPAIMWTANNDNVQLAAVLKDGSPAEGSFAATGGSVITDAGYALAVKAVAPGVTKLKGITMDGSKKRVTCTVTVRGEVTGVKLLSSTARMKAGSGMTLKPILDINGISGSSTVKAEIKKYKTYKKYTDTSVSYRSSDTSVLTVKKNGKVKVNKNASGKSAIVYAVSADGRYKAEIKITVD